MQGLNVMLRMWMEHALFLARRIGGGCTLSGLGVYMSDHRSAGDNFFSFPIGSG